MTREINSIILHCSDLSWGTPEGIRRYHVKHNGWQNIGYHYVITNGLRSSGATYSATTDGHVVLARDINEIGSHAYGNNRDSIGVCYVGKEATPAQLEAIVALCISLREQFGDLEILGHCETRYERSRTNPKTCPNLDMDEVREVIAHRERTTR